jgi:hypothetical protein
VEKIKVNRFAQVPEGVALERKAESVINIAKSVSVCSLYRGEARVEGLPKKSAKGAHHLVVAKVCDEPGQSSRWCGCKYQDL